MRVKKAVHLLLIAFALTASSHANADNGAYSGSGGSFSAGTVVGQNISVQGLPLTGTTATLSFSCPITVTSGLSWTCVGGSVTITSTDNSLILHGTFISGTMSLSGGGGGIGEGNSYTYQFNGSITGTVQPGGVSELFNGSIAQVVKTTALVGTGSAAVTTASLGWNSAYSPVIVADNANGRLLGADNIAGTNLVSYGALGSGIGQFETIAGLAQDQARNIYISDSALDRIVRINDLTGAGWIDLGTSGSGANQFSAPAGVAIDSAGKIWVADAGNNRIVRFDDMTGKNWTAFGTLGAGANQFSNPNSIAFDSQGRIYVTDAGNNRLVRFDDLSGTNWTALTIVNIGPYGYPISSPVAVAIRPSGQINIGVGIGWLLSVSDMTGANGAVSTLGSSITGMSMDGSGTMYVTGSFAPGLAQVLNASAVGYFPASLSGVAFQPGPVLATVSTSPTPAAPALSTTALTFGNQNVGEYGALHQVALTNLGATPLPISFITASPDFKFNPVCPSALSGGASCTIRLRFDPIATGNRAGTLLIETSSVHPVLNLPLSGYGTAPAAIVLPGSLTFQPQQIGTVSGLQIATLFNSGTGPLTISSIAATGDFLRSWNCPISLSPGNGCTIRFRFAPAVAGTLSGALTISDDAIPTGTHQTITLAGVGQATPPAITLSAASLYFPIQQTGTSSPAQTVNLTNRSGTAISLGTTTFPAGFTAIRNCGATLANGAACTFNVVFAPTLTGTVSGTVSTPVTGQSALTFAVSGTGTGANYPAELSLNPLALNFPALQVGDNPTSLTVTITNTAGVPTGIQQIGLIGSNAFSETANNCPAWLLASTSCTVQITLNPVSAGIFSANINVTESSGAFTIIPVSASVTINGN